MSEVLRRSDPPLAPHDDQDGWLYIRVKRHPKGWCMVRPDGARGLAFLSQHRIETDGSPHAYVDSHDESRIIASARVERAVENDDIFRLCAERGLMVQYSPMFYRSWQVFDPVTGTVAEAPTLREAYEAYKEAVDAARREARRNFR